jgi:hypothetical protein
MMSDTNVKKWSECVYDDDHNGVVVIVPWLTLTLPSSH